MMKNVFEIAGNLIGKRYLILLIICLVLIVPAVIGASKVETKVGMETLVPHKSQEYKDYQRLVKNFSEDNIIIVLEADDTEHLMQRDNILAMDAIETKMSAQPKVSAALGPAFMIKFLSGGTEIPDNEEILQMVVDPETEKIKDQYAMLFPDERHAMMMMVVEPGTEDKDLFDLVDLADETVANTVFKDATPIVTGLSDVENETTQKMFDSMLMMIVVAVVIMLVILALIFQVRNFFAWRWMPLGVVVIGIIYTFGIMGYLGVPIGYVTMSAFPILIGLGVGFSVQFHNRFDKAVSQGKPAAKAVIDTMTHIGPATSIAVVVVVLGFAALLTSAMPMIEYFAYSLIIGTIVMYLLSVFLLLPVLFWNDHRKERKRAGDTTAAPAITRKDGFVERGLRGLSLGVVKHPVIIILLAIIVCVAGYILDRQIDAQSDTVKYMSADLQSIKDITYLQELTGGRMPSSILVEAENIADPQVMEWMLKVQEKIKTNEPESVGTVDSFVPLVTQMNGGKVPDAEVTKNIISVIPKAFTMNYVTSDLTAANIMLTIPGMNTDDLRALKGRLNGYIDDAPAGVNASVTGQQIVAYKMSTGLTSDREKMTWIGMGFVFAGLLVLFRFRVKQAIVAALPTVLIIGWAAIILYLIGIEYNPAVATRGALGMGIGVMFTILLMNRYREERDSGQAPADAVTSAMVNVGRPIIACGLTVIGGFAALLMAKDFPFIVDFGIITLVTVFLGLASTLIVLPPMIVLTDSWHSKRSARAVAD
jgi:hydrophobe/amphiphile efflux-3 (HAE3) family protein